MFWIYVVATCGIFNSHVDLKQQHDLADKTSPFCWNKLGISWLPIKQSCALRDPSCQWHYSEWTPSGNNGLFDPATGALKDNYIFPFIKPFHVCDERSQLSSIWLFKPFVAVQFSLIEAIVFFNI